MHSRLGVVCVKVNELSYLISERRCAGRRAPRLTTSLALTNIASDIDSAAADECRAPTLCIHRGWGSGRRPEQGRRERGTGGRERERDWDRGTNTDEKKSNRNLQLVELLIDSAYFTLQLWQLRNNFVEEINQ